MSQGDRTASHSRQQEGSLTGAILSDYNVSGLEQNDERERPVPGDLRHRGLGEASTSYAHEGLESAMHRLSVSDSGRGGGRDSRALHTASSDPGPRQWIPQYVSPQIEPYGAMGFAPRQVPIQWMPFHPSMAYGMYGEPRPGVYYDSRFPRPPYQQGFYAVPPYIQPPLQAPYPGYYTQQRQILPAVRQRPPRPTKPTQDTSETYDFDPKEAEQRPGTCRKTLMLRNIPNKYSIHMLLEMLDTCHGRGPNQLVYDFCYLPIDFKNRCNLGYAFVNFIDADSTLQCYRTFHEKRWNDFNSKKVCEVKYGRVQGREALIEHFKNSKFPSNDVDSLPLLFEETTAEDGTKAVRSLPLHSRQPS